MLFLRQSTASQEILLGPFVDDADGKTAETGLTIANTDIKLWVEGGTSEASKNSGGATHIASGRYYAVLDATDTATLGKMEVNVHVSGALPVRREFMVLSAVVYDSLVLGTDLLDVSVTQLGGVAQSLTDLKDFADDGYDPSTNKVQGVVLTDTVTTYTGNTPQTGDSYAIVNSGTHGNAALKTLIDTIDNFVDTEVAAIKAKTDNLPSDPADASDIAAAFSTVNSTLMTIAAYIDTEVAAIKAKTDNLPSDPADASDTAASFSSLASTLTTIASYIDTEVAAIKAKTDNLPSDPADASDIATAFSGVNTKLDTIDDFLDTEIAAIKAKTDNLPSDPADASVIAGRFDTLDSAIAVVDGNVDAILVDTGTTIPDLIDDIEGGGGGGEGSTEVITQEVTVGEHYVNTGDSLTAFRFYTTRLVDGAFEPYTYSDMELALYVDGVLSGTVPTFTEIEEGTLQLAGTLPTITAGQRLRITATSDEADVTSDVWFGIVPSAGSGGGGTVVGRFDDEDADSPNVTWYTNETAKPKTVSCFDAAGEPIDLNDFTLTNAYLVIERAGPPRTDIQTIAIGDIDIGGDDDNELTFQADAAVLGAKGDFIWAFRQANKSVIASGRITVRYAADVDP